ncbi:hypothetical protein [Rhodococcus wratislaviensis]|uniref:hypothetical protein n=1 Tax=Rhodococcus wratislaviensis TaxID=44752 RepID=UPI001CEC02CC|nr:hypothetical protein [Rhodococcus wratislaviensis]
MTQAPRSRPGSHDDLGGALAAALPERMRDGVLAYRQVSVMFDVVGLGRWVVCTRFGTVSGETRIRGGRRPPPAHDHRPAGAVGGPAWLRAPAAVRMARGPPAP